MALSSFIKDMIMARKLKFGQGRFELMGVKGVILPAYTVLSFAENVYDEDGEEIYDYGFQTGKKHGKYAIERQGRDQNLSKKEFVTGLVDAANVMGIGKISVEDFNPESQKLIINLKKPLTLDTETEFDQKKFVIHFVRGIYHGMGEEIFDGEINSNVEKTGKELHRIHIEGVT